MKTEQNGDAVRLFVAARVSLATVRAVEEQLLALKPQVADMNVEARWVPAANLHVTLKFLGWSRPAIVEALRDDIERCLAGIRAFSFRCVGLGAFPDQSKAKVLWAGIDPEGGKLLGEVAGRIDAAVAALGFAKEQRAYHPHITLARFPQPSSVAPVLNRVPEQAYRESRIESIVLFESSITTAGSEYKEIATWPLESSSNDRRRHTKSVEPGSKGNSPAQEHEDG